MDLQQRVLQEIKREEVVALTQELVRIPSYYGVPGVETKVARFIADFLQREGITAATEEIFEERSNVYAALPGKAGGRSLLFCGHIDTVPPHNMEIEPFEAYLAEGKIYGRGAADMKGGVAAMLVAMAALKRAGVQLSGDVRFAGVVGEESPNTSEGARALVEKGIKTDMAIIGEATNLEIAAAHKGMEWLKIEVRGKAAHGSVPQNGINAISKAAKIIQAIETGVVPRLKQRIHPLVGSPTINIGRIEGGVLNNIVPDSCWFSLDRRWIPGETLEEVLSELQAVIDGLHAEDPELEAKIIQQPETLGRGPMEIESDHPLVLALGHAVRQQLGKEPVVKGVVYWTDGAHLSRAGIPTVVFGPGDIAQAHAAVEFVETEQLFKAAQIYALTALEVCS
ncbi:M20 family metallopeptidase [Zhaonella formicivorans]|uniref:M20 family metallopeptidase n=1 Tax=Zhaonella formicivorans TaxID=2528593 RepID=UPI001D11E14F|nr:M20 family metallopeptidase [Zhaonella formicivorans]